jgi:enoyl-[acyl-carrier protein] reductase I
MGILAGKNALILGLASNRSIAYGVAKSFHEQGANLAFTYQNEKLGKRANKMAEEFGCKITIPCDVTNDTDIENLFIELKKSWPHLDILVHSLAFAPASQITGDFVENIEREGFLMAHDISAYSFPALAKAALPMMEGRQGSFLSMTYMGSEKAFPNYNVMGVAKAALEASVRYMAASVGPKGHRVNAVSAGPIRTLAASGVEGFRDMLAQNEKITPLRRNVTTDEVGQASSFLCSDMASGITGEIVHVDAGFHAVGLPVGLDMPTKD